MPNNTKNIEINEIYNEDCIELIKKMVKQNIIVDAIITDPPYNISKENNFKTIGRAGIDFGSWDKDFNQTEWLKQTFDILKPGGSIIIFNDWKNMGEISRELEKLGFNIKDLIRWVKPAPMPRNVNRRYVVDTEYALWAVKPGKWTFNKPIDMPYLRPQVDGGITGGKNKIHPTQKSRKAIEQLIFRHTNPGDVIFDPFSGSGEISLNASLNGRRFIGCEINEDYWKKSKKRLNENQIRPAINHLGNKFRMISKLQAQLQIQGIKNFVDVFAGSGIVSASIKEVEKYFINEGDKNLYNILLFLINTKKSTISKEIEKIVKQYSLDKENYNEGYLKLRKKYNKTPVDERNVRELFALILFGFNQQIRFNAKNEFNIPPGKTKWTEYQKDKMFKFVENFENKKTEVHGMDFEDFVTKIRSETNNDETIYYFDPPYLITNATYNNLWNEQTEERLLKLLEKLSKGPNKTKWVLSNVLSSKGIVNKQLEKFIKDHPEFNLIEVDLSYKNSNYQREKCNEKDKEIILKNY